MFENFKKIKPGMWIMILSLGGLIFGLVSKNLSMISKIPIVVICIILIFFGVFIETPIFEEMRTRSDNEFE